MNEQIRIEGTPFTLIRNTYEDDSTIWYIVMGDYRITEPTESKEEQLQKLETEKWNIITTIAVIAVKKTMENPLIQDIDEIETTDKKWESPREREKKTRQEYKPIK